MNLKELAEQNPNDADLGAVIREKLYKNGDAGEMNIKTLADMLQYLISLTGEELSQPVRIAGDDSPDMFVNRAFSVREDIYMNRHDSDDFGTLYDLQSYHEWDFNREDYVILSRRGEINFITGTENPLIVI